jgi:hypothetical protein
VPIEFSEPQAGSVTYYDIFFNFSVILPNFNCILMIGESNHVVAH